MAVDAAAVLAQQAEADQAKQQLVQIQREEEYHIDAGSMLGSDPRPVELKLPLLEQTKVLQSLLRDNTQLLVNQLFQLPVKRDDDGVFAMLPTPTTRLPREKPVPESMPKTKWEQFAEMKGIQKKKKSRMVFDEATQEWKPRWGYGRSGADKSKHGWIEVPDHADPYEDQFEKHATKLKSRTTKNQGQHLKNIAAARLTQRGKSVNPQSIKTELKKAIQIGRTATASAGVFDSDLKGEAKVRREGKRQKRAPVTGMEKKEKRAALEMISRLSGKGSTIATAKGQKDTQTDGQRPKKAVKHCAMRLLDLDHDSSLHCAVQQRKGSQETQGQGKEDLIRLIVFAILALFL
eukprot:TRINITY_DN10739_c0_g1_i6.p1 TRINITY_DN10739_c0_g1~~TRINITY_DN10739_c0_g1_i6.p1  ORF type:complete len:348 (+),score=88.63 TRINITY_DN10739_c0_g1_i6:136-1179(+)